MRVYWVLLYDWLGYVYFRFYLETWLSYVRSCFAPHQTWVLCIHLPSVILNGFLTFTQGLPEQSGCICIILAKAKVSSSPVTTPHPIQCTSFLLPIGGCNHSLPLFSRVPFLVQIHQENPWTVLIQREILQTHPPSFPPYNFLYIHQFGGLVYSFSTLFRFSTTETPCPFSRARIGEVRTPDPKSMDFTLCRPLRLLLLSWVPVG